MHSHVTVRHVCILLLHLMVLSRDARAGHRTSQAHTVAGTRHESSLSCLSRLKTRGPARLTRSCGGSSVDRTLASHHPLVTAALLRSPRVAVALLLLARLPPPPSSAPVRWSHVARGSIAGCGPAGHVYVWRMHSWRSNGCFGGWVELWGGTGGGSGGG